MTSSIREIVKNSFVEELLHNLDILDKKLQEVENISWDGGVSRNEKTERLDVSNSREDVMEHFKEFFYEIKGELIDKFF